MEKIGEIVVFTGGMFLLLITIFSVVAVLSSPVLLNKGWECTKRGEEIYDDRIDKPCIQWTLKQGEDDVLE